MGSAAVEMPVRTAPRLRVTTGRTSDHPSRCKAVAIDRDVPAVDSLDAVHPIIEVLPEIENDLGAVARDLKTSDLRRHAGGRGPRSEGSLRWAHVTCRHRGRACRIVHRDRTLVSAPRSGSGDVWTYQPVDGPRRPRIPAWGGYLDRSARARSDWSTRSVATSAATPAGSMRTPQPALRSEDRASGLSGAADEFRAPKIGTSVRLCRQPGMHPRSGIPPVPWPGANERASCGLWLHD